MENILIRIIQPTDDKALAVIIRDSLMEFGAARPGTVYFDPTTDHLFELFQAKGSRYYTVLTDGRIAGGAGIFPTGGLPPATCELVKMYLLPEARGKGLGKSLIEKCLAFAEEAGYAHVYIESFPELRKALSVYEKFGFRYLNGPMGDSGHFGCDVWMLKDL
jgi:putative acetyltransferase